MPTDWITKHEAAAALATSTRTIERHIKANQIQVRKQQRPGRSPETMCYAADVEKLLPAHAGIVERVPEQAQTTTATPDLAQLLTAILAKMTVATPAPIHATIAAAEAMKAERHSRPWLTLQEAAAVSGLSRQLLKQLASTGEICALKDGRRWRLHVESLNAWRPKPDPLP